MSKETSENSSAEIMKTSTQIDSVEDIDEPFEDDVRNNPASVRFWWRYIMHRTKQRLNSKNKTQYNIGLNALYERALKVLPRSYKIWYAYLKERKSQINGNKINHSSYEEVNSLYERCLVHMNKMPRIWIDYCTLLTFECKITKTRHTFDQALRALPVTQHHHIWPLYVNFIKKHNIPETGIKVFSRYLKFEPNFVEDYVDYLIHHEKYNQAAENLA
eukprot:Sdes_comp21134_c0_seq1m19808